MASRYDSSDKLHKTILRRVAIYIGSDSIDNSSSSLYIKVIFCNKE